MHRSMGWLASIGIGTGMVVGAWAVAPAQSLPLEPTGLTVPTLAVTVPTLPPVTLPVETTLPPVEATLPPTTVAPGVTVPTVPTSEVTVPTVPTSVTVPGGGTVTVPTLPGVTVPSVPSIPGLPTVTLPPVPATVPGGVRPDGLVECAHFLTQQAAQLALQLDARLGALLDADRDGVACELLPSGPATVPAGSTGTVGAASAGLPGAPGASGLPGAAAAGGAAGEPGGRADAGSGGSPGSGAGGSGAPGSPGAIRVAGEPLAATSPMEVPEADAGHLLLTVLAFVLLVGSAAGLARELAARHAAARSTELGLDQAVPA